MLGWRCGSLRRLGELYDDPKIGSLKLASVHLSRLYIIVLYHSLAGL